MSDNHTQKDPMMWKLHTVVASYKEKKLIYAEAQSTDKCEITSNKKSAAYITRLFQTNQL